MFKGEKLLHVPFTLLSSKGKLSRDSSHPMLVGQASESTSGQESPSTFASKSSPRGGLSSVARLVKLGRCKNVVVVAGAGISTASGIPDFRLVCALQHHSSIMAIYFSSVNLLRSY